MSQYYDIHTHKPKELLEDCISITSLYKDFESVEKIKYCSIGMHPRYLYNYMQDFSTLELRALYPNVLAIGECGLDKLSEVDMELQKTIFIHHLQLANTVSKPLIVHCVRAYDEILKIFKTYPPQIPVIFHGFNKKDPIAAKLLKQGYYLSFGASLIHDNFNVLHTFKNIDPGRLFLETDDSNHSIKEIYKAAAHARLVSEEEVILQMENNFHAVFGI